MANILFLAHRIPYPPNKGDKIRSWNFLSRLAKEHTVHAGFFVDDPRDMRYIDDIENCTASLCYEKISPIAQKLLSLRAFLTGKSLTEMAYPYRKLRRYAKSLTADGKLDAVFVFSAAAAPIAFELNDVPIICDLVDVDSEKWKSYGEKASWPFSWLYAREAEKLRAFETKLASRSKACLLVSEQEAALFRSLNPLHSAIIKAIPNGVDIHQFNPALYKAKPSADHILFSGAMDYQPNIDAVVWFCKKVLPAVQVKHPNVEFVIAGGPTPAAVARLAQLPGVSVLGYVGDMAEVIATATLCIAPLQIARGIQNKVLEAMAMAKPVVATSLANEGIDAEHERDLLVADTPTDFALAVDKLLSAPDTSSEIGDRARDYVSQKFSWDQSFRILNTLIVNA